MSEKDLEIDGTIKRFEICYELAWKLLKEYLEDKGIICRNPRECFKQAVVNELIDQEDRWMDMIEDRNLLVHTYGADTSRALFAKIKTEYFSLLEKMYKTIKKEMEDSPLV